MICILQMLWKKIEKISLENWEKLGKINPRKNWQPCKGVDSSTEVDPRTGISNDNAHKTVRENGEIPGTCGHYFEKERDVEPDRNRDSNGIWNKVFVVTFLVPLSSRGWQPYSYPPCCISINFLYRIYTFARIARRMTSVPITYSSRHSLHHSPCHSWRSLWNRFFEHESKGTNGDSRYAYKHVNVRTHVKTVFSHRDRGIRMFMQVARRGTSTIV